MAYTTGSATSYNQDAFTADTVRLEGDNASTLEAQRKTEADTANVQHARYIGYAEVLDVYNKRSDTETLADRRARELAVDPVDQDFTRAEGYTGNSTAKQTSRTAD